VSATQLLIKNLSRKAKWTSAWSWTVTIGFYPTLIILSTTDDTTVILDENWVSNKTQTWFDLDWAYNWVVMG